MTDILDEVLNDTKDEKRLFLFRKILPLVIAFTIIGAISITIYNWHKNKTAEHNQQIGDVLVDLVSGEVRNAELVNNSLKQIVDGNENNQAELAELQTVHNLIRSNKEADALSRLEAIIANKSYHEITTSYARLLWFSVILDQKSLSDETQVKARDYMEHFVDDDQLFFANATLIKALFYQKIGQKEKAAEYAEYILKQKNVSVVVKEQAMAVLTSLKKDL